MANKKKYPLISVRWADHWVDNGDISISDAIKQAKPYYGNYAGHLVYENKQVLVLCSNIWEPHEDDTEEELMVSDPMYIMKKAIVFRSDRDADK